MNINNKNQMALGNLSDEDKRLLNEIRSELEPLAEHLSVQPSKELLASVRTKMHLEAARQNSRKARTGLLNMKLPAFVGWAAAAVLIALVSVAAWVNSTNIAQPIGNDVIVYSASTSTLDEQDDTISSEELGLAWIELANMTAAGNSDIQSSSQVSFSGSGLGIYADSEGIFVLAVNEGG